jgi:hypothetical protein
MPLPNSHCMVRIEGAHEAHEHESLIGGRCYWCPGGEPPVITCKSTMLGDGCGHPTEDHIGEGKTPNADCCCCTWLQNDMGHVDGCLDCAIKHGKRQVRIRRLAAPALVSDVEPFIPDGLKAAFWRRYVGKYFDGTLGEHSSNPREDG